MEGKSTPKSYGNLTGILSLGVSLITFLLIINWFFKLTSFQKLEGMPLMIAPLASGIGFVLGFISYKKSPNRFSKWGIVSNTILFVLPFLYWTIGTLVFGL